MSALGQKRTLSAAPFDGRFAPQADVQADVAEAETHDQNGAANADCLDEGGRRLDVIELAEDSVLIERLLKRLRTFLGVM